MCSVLTSMGEPLDLMDDNPTAENIAQLIWRAAHDAGLMVAEVRLCETATRRATDRGEAWTE